MHLLQPHRPSTSTHAHAAYACQRPQTGETLHQTAVGTLLRLQQHAVDASATSPSNPSTFRQTISQRHTQLPRVYHKKTTRRETPNIQM